jgi:26S proteasome regulatory subunit N2
MAGLTSAAGLVGFLSEPDNALRSFALNALNDNIDLLWPEVSGHIGQMYVLWQRVNQSLPSFARQPYIKWIRS